MSSHHLVKVLKWPGRDVMLPVSQKKMLEIWHRNSGVNFLICDNRFQPVFVRALLQIHLLLNPLLRRHAQCWWPAASVSHAWQSKTKKKTDCSNDEPRGSCFSGLLSQDLGRPHEVLAQISSCRMESYFEFQVLTHKAARDAKYAPSCLRGFVLLVLGPGKSWANPL